MYAYCLLLLDTGKLLFVMADCCNNELVQESYSDIGHNAVESITNFYHYLFSSSDKTDQEANATYQLN